MSRYSPPPRPRRRSVSGLPVDGAVIPREPRVIRRRHTGAWLAMTLALLGIVGATVAWHLKTTSYFVVRQVNVSGTVSLDAQIVKSRSGVIGRPIYDAEPLSAEAAIEKIPLVRSAQVRRVWPHTISIVVRERQPWGTWQIGGVNYLVDTSGVVLDIVSRPAATSVYELDAAPGLQPGDRVDADAIHTAQVVVEKLPSTISQQVARLEYSSEDGLELLTDKGVRVRLGDSQGLNYKLAVWQALNAKLGADRVHLIDLRSSNRPYYR
jgi:cell division septal protein FtsQ